MVPGGPQAGYGLGEREEAEDQIGGGLNTVQRPLTRKSRWFNPIIQDVPGADGLKRF
jgi:hypothetical protein